MERIRSCDSPVPANNGEYCKGKNSEPRICNNIQCTFEQILKHPNYQSKSPIGPVDGLWGSWADWSKCSKSCGGGSKTRRRLCDSPAPAHGGTDCQGDHSQERQCNTQPCSVPGMKAGKAVNG